MQTGTDRELDRIAYRAVLKFSVFLAVLILLPAFTLRFWQGWAYLFVFSSALLLITWYFLHHDRELVKRRMRAGAAAETDPSQKKIQTVNSILGVLVYILAGFDHHFQWSKPVSVLLCLAGLAGTAAGFYIIFRVFQANSFTSGVVEVNEDQQVIDTGLYHYVRHPMYSAAIILFLATPFALGSYLSLLPVLALTVMIDVRLKHEERYLADHLPGYREYMQKTKYRLLPGIY